MDFLSFREEITKYIFAEDMLQKADINIDSRKCISAKC